MITNPNPIQIPASESKTFDKLHIFSLNARQPSATTGSISLEMLPATSTGELADERLMQRVSVTLHPALEEVPELQAAFAAIVAAIPAVLAWKAAQVPPAPSLPLTHVQVPPTEQEP